MTPSNRALPALLLLLLAAAPAAAQEPARNAISANPFGLLLELFNAEYERVITESATLGVGGSFGQWDNDFSGEEETYANGDAFFRFYPQGNPLEGWAFGVKLGVTNVPDQGTFFGYGFDLNHSWLMGRNDNFYVGVGFGLKRLVGVEEDDAWDTEYVPTLRIVNVGFAF